MELREAEEALFGGYLAHFAELSGGRRTRAVFNETVRGIIGSESLCCNRIAALSPPAGGHAR